MTFQPTLKLEIKSLKIILVIMLVDLAKSLAIILKEKRLYMLVRVNTIPVQF